LEYTFTGLAQQEAQLPHRDRVTRYVSKFNSCYVSRPMGVTKVPNN